MARPSRQRLAVLSLLAALSLTAAPLQAQWPPDSLTNLQVLPEDIDVRELTGIMAGFTRALGVRCSHCHMGEEGQSLAEYDFASDEKTLKRKAREMMRMVGEVNASHLALLPSRNDPPVEVGCITCHRGTRVPRTLQEEMLIAYDRGGMDRLSARYAELRERYYGRATYDFGDVPLTDVGAELQGRGELAHAEAVHALNVRMNPGAWFPQWRHFDAAVLLAFREEGVEGGVARYRELASRYDERAVQEPSVDQVGHALLRDGRVAEALALFGLNVEAHPGSANAHLSLGTARERAGQREEARSSYRRALEIDPTHERARRALEALGSG